MILKITVIAVIADEFINLYEENLWKLGYECFLSNPVVNKIQDRCRFVMEAGLMIKRRRQQMNWQDRKRKVRLLRGQRKRCSGEGDVGQRMERQLVKEGCFIEERMINIQGEGKTRWDSSHGSGNRQKVDIMVLGGVEKQVKFEVKRKDRTRR